MKKTTTGKFLDPISRIKYSSYESGESVFRGDDIPAKSHMYLKDIFILNHGPEEKYRPYLLMSGLIGSLEGKFPYGYDTINLDERNLPEAAVAYDLTDEELSDLTLKGLYDDKFKIPQELLDSEIEVPVMTEILGFAPLTPAESPILFAGVKEPYRLSLDMETAGYSITDYFKPLKKEKENIKDIPQYDDFIYEDEETLFPEDKKETPEDIKEDEIINDIDVDSKNRREEIRDIFAEIKDRTDKERLREEYGEEYYEEEDEDVKDSISEEDLARQYEKERLERLKNETAMRERQEIIDEERHEEIKEEIKEMHKTSSKDYIPVAEDYDSDHDIDY